MDELLKKFQDQASEILSEDEKRILGIGTRKQTRRELDETVQQQMIHSYNAPDAARPLVPIQGKDSDGEIVFFFEDKEDAQDLYSFFVESKLLEAGEIVYRDIEEQYSVAFMPHVVVTKPEMIQAAMYAYEEDIHLESEEDEVNLVRVMEAVEDALLTEAPTKTAGAPKRKRGMGNPFHKLSDGKFTGVSQHAKDGGGSWAIGKTKLKFTGKGKTKEGGLLGKYGSTKHPCGRDDRPDGSTRCWDGKQGAGLRIAKVMRKKKRAKEDLDIMDLSLIMEMRNKYANL